MKQDWSEAQVRSYIESLNYFNWAYNEQDRRVIQNDWKDMLWLEKHGFEFSSDMHHGRIDHQYHVYDPDDGSEIYFSEVSDWQERRMIFHVRNHMREIIGLPALDEEDFEKMLLNILDKKYRYQPLLEYGEIEKQVAIQYGYDPNKYSIADIERDATDIEKFIYSIVPNNINVFIKAAKMTCEGNVERFEDNYTNNGPYEYMVRESFSNICRILIYDLFDYQFDQRYPECYYGSRSVLYKHFIYILYKKYTGCSLPN